MSSKKSKKSTLPPPSARPFPRRLVPFRHPDFSDDQIQRLTEGPLLAKDRLLRTLRKLDSAAGLLSVPTNKESQNDAVHTAPVSPGSGPAPSEGELISAMMARLVWLETKLSEAHRQLQVKEKTISHLEEQISILNQARGAYEGNPVHELEETCLSLQNQIHHMERFLNDLGVIWVGDKRLSNSSGSTVTSNEGEPLEDGNWNKPPPSPEPGSTEDGNTKVDYDLVIENIQDLNILAGEGVPQICMSPEGAKFKLIDHVPLTLYSNGISLCGGPFRPFTDNTTMQCVQDLMDGYFPSELQRKYPNGVPLKVIDKRHLEFRERERQTTFCGVKTLPVPISRSPSLSPVSPVSPPSPLSGASPPSRTSDTTQNPQMTVQHLLNSLPRAVIRDGRLLDIRHSIAQLLKGSGHSLDIILIHTPVIQHLREGRAVKSITTLRIRSETGNETYLMKLYVTDTIGDVRKYLDLQRSSESADYNILALYPRRVFSKTDDTLEDCGLVPNAALHLRQVTHTSS